MAGMTDSLRILITANGAQAEREFAKVGAASRKSLGMAETNAQRYSRSLTSAGVAMASFGAVALIGLGKAAQAAEEERGALLRLENSIQNMPELAGATTDAFLEQAAALQDSTRFADDMTVSAQAMLGTFHLTEQQILDLIPAVQDYAAKFGVDLVTASKQVGRAVSGSAGALTRNGIVMDEAAFAADHYGTVLSALRENAGGFAAEEGQTLSGQIEILKNNMMDLAEGVGVGATEAFSDMAGAVKFLADRFDDLDPATQSAIGQVATWGAVGLTAVGATSFLVGQLLKLGPAFQFIGAIGPRVYAAVANMIVPTTALTVATDGLAASQTAAAASGAAMAAPLALTVGGLVAFAAASSVAVEQFGKLIGMDWPSGFSTNVHQWNGEVADAIAANPGLVDALSTGKQGFDNIGTSMAAASTNLDTLSQEIQDYLDGVYDLPEANRALADSYDALFALQLSGTASTNDLAAGYQAIVEAVAGVISAGGDADAVARQNILTLRDQYNQGLINQQDYRDQREAILNIPGVSRTLFEQPGMPEAQFNTIVYRGQVYSVPPNWATTFQANTGSAIASVQALIDRIHVLNNTVVRPQGTGIAGQIGAISDRIWGESAAGPTWSVQDSGRPARAMSELGGQPSGSSGAGIVVNVYGKATAADAQPVVDALRRWSQRNGPVPIKVNG